METQTDRTAFYNVLRDAAAQRRYVRLEYLTDLSEFIKADVLIKATQRSETGPEALELATGETVPFENVVSIGGQLSPNFPGYANYSCDC